LSSVPRGLLILTLGAASTGEESEGTVVDTIKTYLPPLGRVLLCSLFVWEGVQQLLSPGGTAHYFATLNIPMPEVAVWISIVIHLVGGLAILVGFKTRWAATVLALFCLGTGFGVHLPIGDLDNMIHFYKNLAIAGGFLYVVAFGAGNLSIDGPAA
jgi:putative oxidoreductase